MRPLPYGRHRTPLIITRRTHPLIKELRELRDRPHKNLLFLEGPRLVEEALRASIPLKTLILSKTFKKNAELMGRAKAAAQTTFSVDESIFRSISDVEEPQGILAIGEGPRWNWLQIFQKSPAPVLVLEGLQNPGNLASIIRTAEAAGAAGVITTPGTARLNSPKALRGAMGSTLRFPAIEHVPVPDIIERLTGAGCMLYGTLVDRDQHLPASVTYTGIDWTQASAIVLGKEGGGISDTWTKSLQQTITIPMQSPVESLNVAAAAAILLYEALRQRTENVK